MPTLPTNPHYVGDSGHVNDHNKIVTALSDGIYKTASADQTITAQSATVTPLAVKGASGQTDKLLEAQNNAGSVVASIANDGAIYAGGGAFPLPFRMACGSGYGGAGNTAVTFPASRFTVGPILFLSSYDGGSVFPYIVSGTVTASGFTYKNTSGANITMEYVAIQMTSSAATG